MRATENALESRDGIGAIVTGADYRALGVVRSLGRRGIPVWVLKKANYPLAGASRYARHTLVWPEGEEARRAEFLLNLAVSRGLKGWVLFSTNDNAVGLVARHHTSLAQQFRVTTPPWEVLRPLCDKWLLHQLAKGLDIDQPSTICPRNRNELAKLNCTFPVIVKPTIREADNLLTVAKAWRVDDRDSLLARYDDACALMSPNHILIQELVPGGGESQFSYGALCLDGHPLASVTARETRQFPTDFGRFSTHVETVEEPGVVEPAIRLLAAVRYNGLVEVEFKRDPRDGRFKVLDVNPRVWGWHTLGARAGVDFPYLLWLLARGGKIAEAHGRPGVRWIRESADLPVAVIQILRGRLSMRDYLRSLRPPLVLAIFASDDPVPGLLEPLLLAYLFGKQLFPRLRHRLISFWRSKSARSRIHS